MARGRSDGRTVLGIVLLAATAIGAIGIGAVEAPRKIRVLYTDDMGGYWEPCG